LIDLNQYLFGFILKFSETIERPGYFVRNALTFKILKLDLFTVLQRSVVRSAADANHRNKRASFQSDVQESLRLSDTKQNFVNFQNLLFPLQDAILFLGYGKSQEQDLQLGVLECKVYHNVLLNLNSKS
jgi:hypothetical protein